MSFFGGPQLGNSKNFEADFIEEAMKSALSIIQRSAKRWKKRSCPLGCILFVREIE